MDFNGTDMTTWQKTLYKSTDELRKKMKSKKIIPLLAEKHCITNGDKERMQNMTEEKSITTEMITTLMKLNFNPLQQLKVALIKTGQSELI